MACAPGLSLGMASCIEQYGDLKMLGISSVKTTYASAGAAQSKESVRAFIQENATMIMTNDIAGLESTNVEVITEQDMFGRTVPVRDNPGSDIIHLKTNPADFNGFVGAFKGETYYIEPYLTPRVKLLHRNNDGTLSGFKGILKAPPVGLPSMDGKTAQYKLNCYWDNVEDWNNVELVQLVDDFSEYVDYMPEGWDYRTTTAYAATNQSIKLWDRAYASTDAAGEMTETPTARIIAYNVDVPAVSAGAPTAGVSVLTVTKDTVPVTLAATDYITFVLEDKTGAVVNYTSQPITIKGV